MSLSRTQFKNLLQLHKKFTAEAFKEYSPDHKYTNNTWRTSIGGFAAFHQIAGLNIGDSYLHYPIIEVDNEILTTHEACAQVFGEWFVPIFYTGENMPDTFTTPKTFDKAHNALARYILDNKPEDNNNETFSDKSTIEEFSDEVSYPADDTLEVYRDQPSNVYHSPDDEPAYVQDHDEGDYANLGDKACAPEVAYKNPALDINSIFNYHSNIIDDPEVDISYPALTDHINKHLQRAMLTFKTSALSDTTLIFQNDGSDEQVELFVRAFHDYSDASHDVYVNSAATRLVFLIH